MPRWMLWIHDAHEYGTTTPVVRPGPRSRAANAKLGRWPRGRRIVTGSAKRPVCNASNAARAAAAAQAPVVQPLRSSPSGRRDVAAILIPVGDRIMAGPDAVSQSREQGWRGRSGVAVRGRPAHHRLAERAVLHLIVLEIVIHRELPEQDHGVLLGLLTV